MSPDDLETVRRAYDAFARGDLETLRGLLAPDIEWRTTPEVPFMGNYEGLDEFIRGMDEWTESFDDITTEIEEMLDAGDNVIVGHRMRGRGKDSGVEVDLAIFQVVAVRDGQLTRMHDFASREDALQAAAVGLVRRNIDAMQRALDAYWRDRRSIAAALDQGELWPEWEEAFAVLDPDIEWRTIFLGQTFRGHREMAQVWDDFLKRLEDYRLTLEEVEAVDGGRVLAVMAATGRGKDSGARLDSRLFQVSTVKDGRIVRLQEFTSRDEALAAAAQLQG